MNKPIPLHEVFEYFLSAQKNLGGRASATIDNYKENFKLLLEFNPTLTTYDLNENLIIDFFQYLNTRERMVGKNLIVRTYKNSSIATVRSKLNPFFKWLVDRYHIDKNPFDSLPYPTVNYTDSRALTRNEYSELCELINTRIAWENLLIKKRNIALIMTLFYSGIRKGELLGLKVSDINFEAKNITIRSETSKSKRTRIIPLNRELSWYIKDYLISRQNMNCEGLWVSSKFDSQLTEHGLKHFVNNINSKLSFNFHLHRLRHTFAVAFYKQTKDLIGLHKILGHSSLKMTLTYLRSLDDKDLIEGVSKMTIAEFC